MKDEYNPLESAEWMALEFEPGAVELFCGCVVEVIIYEGDNTTVVIQRTCPSLRRIYKSKAFFSGKKKDKWVIHSHLILNVTKGRYRDWVEWLEEGDEDADKEQS